jgi:hypothetical protein
MHMKVSKIADVYLEWEYFECPAAYNLFNLRWYKNIKFLV